MSKNHYSNLEKNDILFVNNGKKNVAMYLFDGTDFQKITVEDVDLMPTQAIVGLSEFKQQENMELEALKSDVNTLANEISQLKSDNNVININLGGSDYRAFVEGISKEQKD